MGGFQVTAAEAARVRVQWTDGDGCVGCGFGRLTLRATPVVPVLRVQEPDAEGLQRVMAVVTPSGALQAPRPPGRGQAVGGAGAGPGRGVRRGTGGGPGR